MSVIPIDKHDRDSLLYTVDSLKTGIEKGEVTGFIVIATMKDGGNIHAHNADVTEFPRMVGLMELKKRELLNRYESTVDYD